MTFSTTWLALSIRWTTGKQDPPVALTELLDHGGRFLGGTGHNLIWFLHGGWLLLRICVWQPDSIETGATAVTNLQLQMGHPRARSPDHRKSSG